MKMGYRYYDSEAGRFISQDPLGFLGGDVDLYTYVADNPATLADFYGLAKCTPSANRSCESAEANENIIEMSIWSVTITASRIRCSRRPLNLSTGLDNNQSGQAVTKAEFESATGL